MYLFHRIDNSKNITKKQQQGPPPNTNDYNRYYDGDKDYGSCAILLFGLPRAFEQYVLPSFVQNVVQVNARYGCDYFVHYYHQDRETSNGRSGRGGQINPDSINNLLPSSIHQVMQQQQQQKQNDTATTVSIIYDTNETFWNVRETQIMKYRNTRNEDGTLTYFPYTEPTYVYPGTIDNIVKQWHSIDAVWNHMKNEKAKKTYKRIAMMRNDVIYVTPIDIYQTPLSKEDTNNHKTDDIVRIPNFAKYPINDRLIIGPYNAVETWATQRFTRIDQYATNEALPGTAMHSETFLNATILASIRQTYQVYEDPWICFLRVRADGAIWIEDCDAEKSGFGGGYPGDDILDRLQPFLPTNTTCRERRLPDKVRRVKELICKERSYPASIRNFANPKVRDMLLLRAAAKEKYGNERQ
jgi:quinol monooxygenase YgiN